MANLYRSRELTETEITHWEERIRVSRAMLKRMEARWDETIRRYANRHLPQVVPGDGPNVSVNILLSNVRAKLPFLFYQEPELLVRAKRPNVPMDQPALVKGLLMYYFKSEKMKHKINRCILDGLLQSRGILKVGYSAHTVMNSPELKKGGDPEKPHLGKGGRKSKREASALDQSPPLRIAHEGPVISHVSPRRFLTHPDAKFPIDDHARWVAHVSTKPLELVRIDNRFDPSWRKEVKATEQLKMHSQGFEYTQDAMEGKSNDPSAQFVVLFEIWDKLRREVLVFAENNFSLGPARVVPWPIKGMVGFPFSMYVPLEIPETFESMTELDPIINQVEEMDHFRTMQARHLMRFKRFYEVTTDSMDHDELDKLRVREDGDYVITNAEDGRRSIFPVEDAPIPFDSFRFVQDIRNDIDMVSGVSELRRQGQSSAKTATEASIVDQVQQSRGVFDRQIVDDFVLDSLEKMFKVMQQWLPSGLAVEILGPRGADWVQNVDPRMVAGEFDFEILAGSTVPPNNALLRAEVTNVANIISSNPLFQNLVDPRELLKAILETFPESFRNGRIERILRNQEAVSGPVPGMDLGAGGGPPGAPPGGLPPELMAALGGGGLQ